MFKTNYDTNYPLRSILFLVCLLVSLPACKKQNLLPNSGFNKDIRTELGRQMAASIKANPNIFPLVSPTINKNEPAFQFFDQLYNQAYFKMRDDADSNQENQWDSSRKWKFNVIAKDTEVMAFCLPGGDFYITTGFLQRLTREESDLFFVMTFEAMLMDQEELIMKLPDVALNFNMLMEIAEEGVSSTGTTALDLAIAVSESISYSDEIIERIDIETAISICDRSNYKRTAPFDMIENYTHRWRATRPNYEGRLEVLKTAGKGDCGENDSYQGSTRMRDFISELIYQN